MEAPEAIAEEVSGVLIKSMEAAGNQFCKIVPLTAESEIGSYWIH